LWAQYVKAPCARGDCLIGALRAIRAVERVPDLLHARRICNLGAAPRMSRHVYTMFCGSSARDEVIPAIGLGHS
jgi:hypothetical protein